MEQTVTLEKEFYVETSSQPGTTCELTSWLAQTGNINIKSLWGGTYSGKGHFSFITEDFAKTRKVLEASPYRHFREEEVIVVYVKDQIGSTSEITNKLNNAGVNINWLYTTSYNGKPAIVLSCDNNTRAFEAIKH
jgi:hypothetical protein